MGRRGCLLASRAALAVGALAPAAAPAGDPVADASNIACPTAPSGWALSATEGKQVWDGTHDSRLAGLNQVAVNCNYVTPDWDHIEATVSYALPTDPNPANDFYF